MAKEGLEESKAQNDNIAKFNLLVSEGDQLFEIGDFKYVDALQKYREAREFGILYDLIDDKILKTEKNITRSF